MYDGEPISVAILDDVDLVARGLETMCESASRPFRVRTLTSAEPTQDPVDIVLYDGFTHLHEAPHNAQDLLRTARARHLVIYSWNVKRALVEAALRGGASGYLDKRLGFAELTEALERINDGEQIVRVCAPIAVPAQGSLATLHRPGDLSSREIEIVGLIAQGLSNQDICERLYLSLNTIKSYIRMAYRKMRVRTRAQAVLWALDHGLLAGPDWSPEDRVAG